MPDFIDTMMYVGDTPWHKEGVKLERPPTIQAALHHSGLMWEVQKRPTYYHYHENQTFDGVNYEEVKQVIGTGHFVTVRTDTQQVLGHVSSRYEVLQNREAFEPFEPMLDMGFTLETAGAVQDGKKIWVLAKAPESSKVGDDIIEQYVLLYTSHDGSAGSTFRPTAIRVVCYNTLELALSRESKWNYKLKHTSSIRDRVKNLTGIIEKSDGDFRSAIDDMNRFQDKEMNERELQIYLETVIPFLKNRDKESIPEMGIFVRNTAKPVYDKIVDNFYNGRGNNGKTLWDAYNAITEYYTHDKQYKDWVKQTQFGKPYDYKVKAFKVAKMMAEVDMKVAERLDAPVIISN